MIVGLGTDIIQVERIARALEQYGERFLDKLFTAGEQEYCNSRTNRAEHYAARFAAKEAFSKAIGTGWNESFGWKDIAVERAASGRPSLRLSGSLAQRWNGYRIHLSMSHTSDTAMATVVIEAVSEAGS